MKVNPCTCFRLKEFSFSKSPEMKKSSTATVTLSRCHPFLLRKSSIRSTVVRRSAPSYKPG